MANMSRVLQKSWIMYAAKKMQAVFTYTEKFDGAKIDASNIKVTEEEIKEAYELVGEELTGIIRKALI